MNFTTISRPALTVLALAGTFLQTEAIADDHRWYSERQVQDGEVVYRANCMVCHLEAGAGTEDWQQRDAEGNLTPPPLNGTAHTWHHNLEVLARTVREGGVKLGGTMPPFAGQLDDAAVASVIAYVQSLWPEEIYRNWARAYAEDAERGFELQGGAQNNPITARLVRLLSPDTEIGEPEPTPIEGVYGVAAGSRYVFLDESGRYAFTGDLIDLETRRNLGEQRLGAMRLNRLKEFTDDDKVIFPAIGEQRAHLDIFTDTTCPYCRQLHREVPDLQAAGVSVRYLPFPREGSSGQGYEELRSVWCSDDRQAAMSEAKLEGDYQSGDTDCAAGDLVDSGYRLGLDIGVNGTPAIILPDGRMIPGYQTHARLLDALGIDAR